MKLSLRKVVGRHEVLENPGWYGVAYAEDFGRRLICYPVGLHLLVRWSVWWWNVIRMPPKWQVVYREGEYEQDIRLDERRRVMREMGIMNGPLYADPD